MKISHESPKCLMNMSRLYNDYDYALVHLFESDAYYYNFFVESLKIGREVILDNSVFELGESFDNERFVYWINKLNPTKYIIPDVLEDMDGTINKCIDFKKKYNPAGLSMGVIQGKTYEELVQCYNYMKKNVDIIAISFDYFYYLNSKGSNKWYKFMNGRIDFINKLISDNIIDFNKKHHLLGCALPQEFSYYKNMDFIESVDTSNPIVHSIKNIKYLGTQGLTYKESIKLIDLYNTELNTLNLDLLYYNIEMFRNIIKN